MCTDIVEEYGALSSDGAGTSEMFVSTFQTMWCHIPGDLSLQVNNNMSVSTLYILT